MGEKKFTKPQKIKLNADNDGLYEEMQMAKDNAEEISPNKKNR